MIFMAPHACPRVENPELGMTAAGLRKTFSYKKRAEVVFEGLQ
jgi:hypothetical protein